jgi:spermidine synthase
MPKHRSARQMDAAAPLALAVGPQVEDRSSAAGRWILFALFAASGFAGLVYESIWTHYLKLFLGHAAYAQALVLAIFMGGMALGSWLAARWSGRLRNLLLAYAVTEAAVAAFALVFHELFVSSTGWAHQSVLPHFAGFKWVLSTALILPQCVLLGMTFPLMAAGVLRSYPDRPGRSLSMLYFTNSLGAAIGVLVSGFILVRTLGLPGTIRLAGAINLVVAGAVFLLARGRPTAPPVRAAKEAQRDNAFLFFLAVALITGASSFIYEVAWIRMLSLVLGTSTHSFELMLSAFILGLSLGGLWIQRRIDSLLAPVRTLGLLQLAMGVLALLSLPLYAQTFDLMRWLTNTLERSDAGYAWFILSSSGIALAIMLPATFCAGTTLPLVTVHLMRRGHGESSIGAVYAANTVGAIAAVFFAVHFGLPALGLKGLLVFGGALDIALGVALLWNAAAGFVKRRVPLTWTAAGAAAVALTVLLVQLDPYRMASGVYRRTSILQAADAEILFHRDGKTASVDVVRYPGAELVEIVTNGKSDASVAMKPGAGASLDEPTMILLGALPLALHPQGRRVACIGFGSGVTTHTLLASPRLTRVDTIEIEQEMVRGAEKFRPYNERAYADPRSHVVIDDAKTYFSTQRQKYDVIVSEPSNPWVSGVAGLFSDEFYRLVLRHLADGGVFAQWLQLYEIDLPLVVSVLKALEANFSDYVVYASTRFDLLIMARNGGAIGALDLRSLTIPAVADSLARIGVRGTQDLEVRRVGTRKSWEGLTRSFEVPMNSDYAPLLDQNAARTFFLRVQAGELTTFQKTPFPALEMLSGVPRSRGITAITPGETFEPAQRAIEAMYLFDVLRGTTDASRVRLVASDELQQDAASVSEWLRTCGPMPFASLVRVVQRSLSELSLDEAEAIFQSIESGRCAPALSRLEREWFDLLHAVGLRDPAGMEAGAKLVLSHQGELSPPAIRYAVAAGMLGAITRGDLAGAREIWSGHGGSIPSSGELLLRMLVERSRGQK